MNPGQILYPSTHSTYLPNAEDTTNGHLTVYNPKQSTYSPPPRHTPYPNLRYLAHNHGLSLLDTILSLTITIGCCDLLHKGTCDGIKIILQPVIDAPAAP